MPPIDEYFEEIESLWDTRYLTNAGAIHKRLEDGVKAYLGAKNVELFANGHLALYSVLRALNVSGEVITTPFTFASTTNAIIQCGARPVFCDVKPDYTIDEEKIESLITEKTTAVLAVHVYGNVCNVEAIEKIAEKYGIRVIYDAAHAFGVEYDGSGIANFGDASMFSFHATKVFHTIEGGCVAFSDPTLSEKLARERNFGISGGTLDGFGMNAKMNEFEAAMGVCNLRHIDEELASRRIVSEQYDRRLSGIDGISVLNPTQKQTRNYAYYPVLVDPERFGCDRDRLAAILDEHGIGARKYFYPLTSENRAFERDLSDTTPRAKYYSRNVLCLPLYAHLDLDCVNLICDTVCAAAIK